MKLTKVNSKYSITITPFSQVFGQISRFFQQQYLTIGEGEDADDEEEEDYREQATPYIGL